MPVPAAPKIYHIIHVDRLASVIADGCLWCDAQVLQRNRPGTQIGMSNIKQRRLLELRLSSHPGLLVGGCVPFYFCPRSVMLFIIHMRNHQDLAYRGGQGPIIHLEADLHEVVSWAEQNGRRWAFTLSNAGAYYFEDRNDLNRLGEIDWDAVQATQWGGNNLPHSGKEGKQAEFLLEGCFPWELVSRIGVQSQPVYNQVSAALAGNGHRPTLELKPDWYY